VSIVFDGSVLVDHLRASPQATEAFYGAVESGRRVAASVLTRIELRRACKPEHLLALDDLDAIVDWVPVDHEIAAIAAKHAAEFGNGMRGIDATACVVAATAERLGAELWTTDLRHYPMFDGLQRPY